MKSRYQNLFMLHQPCGNSPSFKQGEIELAPSRLDEIIEVLVQYDMVVH